MKKINSIIAIAMALITILSMSTIAFAAPNSGTPIGDETTQFNFVTNEMELRLGKENPIWNYDTSSLSYTDQNGTVWRWYENRNWIVSSENEQWLYKELDDGTLYIVSNPDVPLDVNLVIPSSLDRKTVTRVRSAGAGINSLVSEPTLSITIPDTVTHIDYFSFRNRKELKRVVIPVSVKSIEVRAFEGTNEIELYYCGTEEQWNDVVVWNQGHTFDYDYWAVTDFNWLDKPIKEQSENVWPSTIKDIHFNVNPNELEPLEPNEESPELGFFGKIIQGFKNIIFKIISIFTF